MTGVAAHITRVTSPTVRVLAAVSLGGAGHLNPLVPFIAALRTVLLAGQAPGAGELAGVAIWLVLALGSGVWVFARYAPIFPEEV